MCWPRDYYINNNGEVYTYVFKNVNLSNNTKTATKTV